jgi:hypothetical protein
LVCLAWRLHVRRSWKRHLPVGKRNRDDRRADIRRLRTAIRRHGSLERLDPHDLPTRLLTCSSITAAGTRQRIAKIEELNGRLLRQPSSFTPIVPLLRRESSQRRSRLWQSLGNLACPRSPSNVTSLLRGYRARGRRPCPRWASTTQAEAVKPDESILAPWPSGSPRRLLVQITHFRCRNGCAITPMIAARPPPPALLRLGWRDVDWWPKARPVVAVLVVCVKEGLNGTSTERIRPTISGMKRGARGAPFLAPGSPPSPD